MNDDWSLEAFDPSPFRKLVAGSDWVAVGNLVFQPGDQVDAHLDLDSRAPAAFADGSLTWGIPLRGFEACVSQHGWCVADQAGA
jgi:hypothetical protein